MITYNLSLSTLDSFRVQGWTVLLREAAISFYPHYYPMYISRYSLLNTGTGQEHLSLKEFLFEILYSALIPQLSCIKHFSELTQWMKVLLFPFYWCTGSITACSNSDVCSTFLRGISTMYYYMFKIQHPEVYLTVYFSLPVTSTYFVMQNKNMLKSDL